VVPNRLKENIKTIYVNKHEFKVETRKERWDDLWLLWVYSYNQVSLNQQKALKFC